MSTAPLEAVRRRDELLSMLYWMRVDRLSDAPTAHELRPFAGDSPALDADFAVLAAAGLVAVRPSGVGGVGGAGPRFALTAAGLEEARRRFEEDFQPPPDDGTAGNAHEVMLGVCGPNARCVREGTHGECAEPALRGAGGGGGGEPAP
jgi:hypothetical protein